MNRNGSDSRLANPQRFLTHMPTTV